MANVGNWRRVGRDAAWCAAALLLLSGVVAWQTNTLGPASFTTGYLLLAAVVFLAAYNVRKKIPYIPLGNSATWLRLHCWVGVGAFGVFALHTGASAPNGWFESLLWCSFTATFASGVYGLYLTRTAPRMLSALPEEVLYERIPRLRRETQQNAERLALHCADAGCDVMTHFYLEHAAAYFGLSPGVGVPHVAERKKKTQPVRKVSRGRALPVGRRQGVATAHGRTDSPARRPRLSRCRARPTENLALCAYRPHGRTAVRRGAAHGAGTRFR